MRWISNGDIVRERNANTKSVVQTNLVVDWMVQDLRFNLGSYSVGKNQGSLVQRVTLMMNDLTKMRMGGRPATGDQSAQG